MMKILDGRTSFYQWDTNQQVVCDSFEVGDEVHFYNLKQPKALIVSAYELNGVIVANVPNILLQSSYPITVYKMYVDSFCRHTRKEYTFKVHQRPRPTDYVYTEVEIFNYKDLSLRIEELEKNGVSSEQISTAVEKYLDENPIESGISPEEVQQINTNKENIEKLNSNKLDTSKLPEAINEALVQAKASGEFNGNDYVLTEADKQEIAEMAAEKVDVPEGEGVELDTTLTQSGKAADSKAVGDRFGELSEQKVDKPTSGNGTAGQALLTNGDGTTYWGNVSSGGEPGEVITNIVQTIGDSETAVMSQKAVTDEFAKIIIRYSEGINKYKPTTEGWINSALIYSSGKIVEEEGKGAYCVTPKIPVKSNTTYTITPSICGILADANRGRAYDSNDIPLTKLEWIQNTDNSLTFTTPENVEYIRFTVYKESIGSNESYSIEHPVECFNTKFMLVEGTETPSKFVPYTDETIAINEDLIKEILKPYVKKEDALFLSKKVVVNFGDSIFGNARPPEDVSTFLATLTGATVHNCAFGGCRMGVHTGHWDAFSMYRLADAVATGDYSLQDDALNYDDRTSYAEEPLALLKSIDFNEVDIITIAYGTNDWTGGNQLDNEDNLYDTTFFGGALRYSIERLLGAYPHLKIFVLCPTYRFWMNESGEFSEDSDTKTTGNNTLVEYVELVRTIAKEYHVSFIDNYYELGINKFNKGYYFPATDGTHHNKAGRILLAEHIARELF